MRESLLSTGDHLCPTTLARPLSDGTRLSIAWPALPAPVILTIPYRAPTANAIAERWIGSVRRECLDHLPIVSEAHLRHVLTAYIAHYNEARPHQGLDQRTPVPREQGIGQGLVRRRDRPGGLLREYDREAA